MMQSDAGTRHADPGRIRRRVPGGSAAMSVGVFIPIGNNGWLISETSPQYMPSFELNKEIAQKAERYGLDFALSMIKLRGFGGKTEFWDHNLESLHPDGGARRRHHADQAVRHRARRCAMPPAIVGAHGRDHRFDLRRALRPEPDHRLAEGRNTTRWACGRATSTSRNRYDYLAEYVQILRELWETGRQRLQGQVLPDGRLPAQPPAAGDDEDHLRRLRATRAWPSPPSTPTTTSASARASTRPPPSRPSSTTAARRPRAKTGPRRRRPTSLFMIIADETDEEAMAKWELYQDGADQEALAWLDAPGRGRHQVRRRHQRAPARRPGVGGEPQHGHPGRLLRQRGAHAGRDRRPCPAPAGVLLTFDDFVKGVENFGDTHPAADEIAPARQSAAPLAEAA